MGQYFMPANLDKRQYLDPRKFDCGLKLMELAESPVMAGVAILLADSNGRGGGDCRSSNPVIGTWAGDRIVITGDYADAKDGEENLYSQLDFWEDISPQVLAALREDAGPE